MYTTTTTTTKCVPHDISTKKLIWVILLNYPNALSLLCLGGRRLRFAHCKLYQHWKLIHEQKDKVGRQRERERWIEGCGSCNYSSGPLETFSCISKSSGQIEPMSTTGNLILFAANTHTQKLLDGFSLSLTYFSNWLLDWKSFSSSFVICEFLFRCVQVVLLVFFLLDWFHWPCSQSECGRTFCWSHSLQHRHQVMEIYERSLSALADLPFIVFRLPFLLYSRVRFFRSLLICYVVAWAFDEIAYCAITLFLATFIRSLLVPFFYVIIISITCMRFFLRSTQHCC